MPDDWTWRDDARSFFRWNAWQPIWDWFWQTRLGKAVITGVGGLILGVIGKLYSPPVFYIGLGVVFAVSIVFGADILSAIRSRMRPVTRDEAKSIAAQIEDFLRGKEIVIGGQSNSVLATTTTPTIISSGYVRCDAPHKLAVQVEINLGALQTANSEHWARLDFTKRSIFTQALLSAPKSQDRSFDVMIANLPQSDCRDLGIDLRDAIHEAGLAVMGIQEMISPAFPAGITIEANKNDPLLPKLLEAFRQIELNAHFQHRETNVLIVRIGRRLG
jgi:hypothetical protein